MSRLMVTVKFPHKPTLDEAMARFGLSAAEVDASFGVQELDPNSGEYVLLVDAAAAQRIQGGAGVTGAFSNPTIGTFGPPEK